VLACKVRQSIRSGIRGAAHVSGKRGEFFCEDTSPSSSQASVLDAALGNVFHGDFEVQACS
jgi:hypothetical protein